MRTVPLGDVVPGTRVVIPLPDGDWITPPGWSRVGDTIRANWTVEHGAEVVLNSPAPVFCGLCGLQITGADDSLAKHGLVPSGLEPDAHVVCYRLCVEEKVSAPGEVASPWDPPAPSVSAWVQPTGAHDAYPAGAVVSHLGRTWTNTHGAGNVWQPSSYGWAEV